MSSVTSVFNSQAPFEGNVKAGLILPNMALVVFLRGINVGGHRRFRPSLLAKELSRYDVVSVGATGTFIVRKPGSRARFCSELLRRLPFEAEVFSCDSRDLLKMEVEDPFATEPARTDTVRFVSVLSKPARLAAPLPITVPADGEWYVRLVAFRDRFVFGVYRRHMRTIGYLGQIDKLFGVPATIRSWKTMMAVARILKCNEKKR